MSIIEQIMDLSGPFTTEKARAAHRNYLEGLSPLKLTDRLAALQESEQRAAARTQQKENRMYRRLLRPAISLRYAR